MTLTSLLLMALTAVAAPNPPPDPAGQPGDLTGAWRLNRSASQMGSGPGADEEGGPVSGRPPGPGGGPRGGFSGPGGFGRGTPSEHDREQIKDRRERVRALMEPVDLLTITQDAERVVIVDGQGRSERLVPNGRKEQHLVGNVQAELKTTWEGGRLVSEIALGGGLTFRRTIAVDTGPDGARRLTIELAPKGGPGGRRPPVRRVYELIE